jgi:hypothetical protein
MTDQPGNPPDAKQLSLMIQNVVLAVAHARETSEKNTASLVDALAEHAKALTKSASASDKAAANLVRATWALVVVTALLVIVGVLQAIILYGSAP